MQEKILVTGGAGFIGTHTVIELVQAGHQVVVVDNLVNSSRKSLEVVERITGVEIPFYEADIMELRESMEEENTPYDNSEEEHPRICIFFRLFVGILIEHLETI